MIATGARLQTDRSRQLLRQLVGGRTGMVRRVRFAELVDGDAELFHAAAETANPFPCEQYAAAWAAGGSGITPDAALQAALGEAVERFASSWYDSGCLVRRSVPQLRGEGWEPAMLSAFSEEQYNASQFPFVRLCDQHSLFCANGQWLDSGEAAPLPAFATYLIYQPRDDEPLIAPGLSTGLACAATLDDAILRALCEVIERDAVALTWLKGITPPAIEASWLYENAGDLLPPRDNVRAYDLTSDVGLPVVFVVCRGSGLCGPIIAVGSACHPEARVAVRKAALEASQGRVYVRQLLAAEPRWQPNADFSNVLNFSHSARLYSACPEIADRAFQLLDGHPTVSELPHASAPCHARPSELVARIAKRLSNCGHRCAWIDLTPAGAETIGLHVVRVIIPSLMPLHGDHRLAILGHPRLSSAAAALPNSICRHSQARWPWPHPMP